MKNLSICCLILLIAGCKTTPKAVAPRPSPPPRPAREVYIIIDDAGQNLSQCASFFNLEAPLSMAVLPGCPCSEKVAHIVYNKYPSKEVILHQPMEAMNPRINPGPGAILADTPVDQVAEILTRNMAQVPGAKGMNNHMGSRVTQNRQLMEATMAFCKENNLFFIDSLTIASSIAGGVARQYGVPTATLQVYLDNDHQEETIRNQFNKGLAIAAKTGSVIMIGHTWSPNTAIVLRDMYPAAVHEGFTFHTISEIF